MLGAVGEAKKEHNDDIQIDTIPMRAIHFNQFMTNGVQDQAANAGIAGVNQTTITA